MYIGSADGGAPFIHPSPIVASLHPQAGHMLAAGSPSGSDTNVSDLGIVQGHAYAILNVVEQDGHKLMQV